MSKAGGSALADRKKAHLDDRYEDFLQDNNEWNDWQVFLIKILFLLLL